MFVGKRITPVVCTGDYNPNTHGPFFDSLRSLLHRRYRKNVTRSLIRHLRSEYGDESSTIFNMDSITIREDDILTRISKLKARGLIMECEDENYILSKFNFNDAREISFSVHPWVTRMQTAAQVASDKTRSSSVGRMKKLKHKHKRSRLGMSRADSKEIRKDIEVGSDAVARAANSTWWDWSAGSTLFFWRKFNR